MLKIWHILCIKPSKERLNDNSNVFIYEAPFPIILYKIENAEREKNKNKNSLTDWLILYSMFLQSSQLIIVLFVAMQRNSLLIALL